MLNHTKGGNHISDKMVLNRKRHIYSNKENIIKGEGIKKDLSSNESEIPLLFVVRGKPDFSDLNLREYGWKRINNHSPEEKKFFKNTSGYKEYKELIIYEGPQGIAVVQANYKKDKHKIAIYPNFLSEEDPYKMKAVKLMFEREWGLRLEEDEYSNKEKNSGLENKIESN